MQAAVNRCRDETVAFEWKIINHFDETVCKRMKGGIMHLPVESVDLSDEYKRRCWIPLKMLFRMIQPSDRSLLLRRGADQCLIKWYNTLFHLRIPDLGSKDDLIQKFEARYEEVHKGMRPGEATAAAKAGLVMMPGILQGTPEEKAAELEIRKRTVAATFVNVTTLENAMKGSHARMEHAIAEYNADEAALKEANFDMLAKFMGYWNTSFMR